MGMISHTPHPKAPFRFEPIDGGLAARIVDFNDTPFAECWDRTHARRLVALLNRGSMDLVPQHAEVKDVLDRWDGQLPLEVVALILGLDARVAALSPVPSCEAGSDTSQRSAAS